MASLVTRAPFAGSKGLGAVPDAFDMSHNVGVHPSKLFIGGITRHTTTKQLRDHFSRYGRVLDCVAMRQPDGRPRGFGYVTLDSPAAADRCLAETQVVDGRVVDMKRAVPEGSGCCLPRRDSWVGEEPQVLQDLGSMEVPGPVGHVERPVWPWAPQKPLGGMPDCVELLSRRASPPQAHTDFENAPTWLQSIVDPSRVQVSRQLGLSPSAPEFVPAGGSLPQVADQQPSLLLGRSQARTPLGELTNMLPLGVSNVGKASDKLGAFPLISSTWMDLGRENMRTPATKKTASRMRLAEDGDDGGAGEAPPPADAAAAEAAMKENLEPEARDAERYGKRASLLEAPCQDSDESSSSLADTSPTATPGSLGIVALDSETLASPPGSDGDHVWWDPPAPQRQQGLLATPLPPQQPLPAAPRSFGRSSPLPSVGSEEHDAGTCRRCNFFPKGRCQNGRNCTFCHYSHDKRKPSRQEKRERRAAWLALQNDDEVVGSGLQAECDEDEGYGGGPAQQIGTYPVFSGLPLIRSATLPPPLSVPCTVDAAAPGYPRLPPGLPPPQHDIDLWQLDDEAMPILATVPQSTSTTPQSRAPLPEVGAEDEAQDGSAGGKHESNLPTGRPKSDQEQFTWTREELLRLRRKD